VSCSGVMCDNRPFFYSHDFCVGENRAAIRVIDGHHRIDSSTTEDRVATRVIDLHHRISIVLRYMIEFLLLLVVLRLIYIRGRRNKTSLS
jgi:hypothetical protein